MSNVGNGDAGTPTAGAASPSPDAAAEPFVEAALVAPDDHRRGDVERAERIFASAPDAVTGSIHAAAMRGELEAVERILATDPAGASRRCGQRQWEPLLYLCFSRYLRVDPHRAVRMVETASLLLAHGGDPNAFWIDGKEAEGNRETCIYGAAGIANNRELTTLLLDAGADPNDGETPYHSVEHDGGPCLDLLWPHFSEDSRSIAIQHKIDYDDPAGIRKLLELGADANAQRFTKRTPLHGAVFRGHGREIFELLFAHGADPELVDQDGRTPYAWAARSGRRETMALLAAHGASTDLSPIDAFVAACATGEKVAVEAILAARPGILDELGDDDRGSICEAAAAGNTTGVATMLDAGFDIDARGRVWKEAPIHRAAMGGHRDTVELLLGRGADLTVRDACYHASPLGWAAHGGHDEIVELLLGDPSRLDLRDAVEFGKAARVGELIGDLQPDDPVGGGEPGVLLRAAANGGHLELVELLLERGADPRLRNSEGLTAADYALQQGHDDIGRLLASRAG